MSTHDDILAEDQDGRIRSENSINNVMNQDPVPFLTPGSGIQDGGKNIRIRNRMDIPDIFPRTWNNFLG
jgi:hypothetical protein